MNKLLLLSLALLVIIPAQAKTVFELKDYAWQSTVTASDDDLQRIDLTVDILKGMSNAQAADIAVFDANGQALPAMLRKKTSQTKAAQIDLSFHQFNREYVTGTAGKLTIDQQQVDSENNQVSRLEYEQQLAVKENRSDYIIELTDQQMQQGISDIELEWTHQPATDFLKLTIQVANDLDHWKTIQSEKNLFNEQGRKGEWVTLTQLPTQYRYIRLTPHKEISEFNLIRATGKYVTTTEAPDLIYQTDSALKEDAKHAGYYHFQQPFKVDAKGMILVLPPGYFISGSLYGSNNGFDKKVLITSNLKQHNMSNISYNEPFNISQYQYSDWWLKTDTELSVPVKLSFTYPAYEFYFINNQQGPFTLAWGNYEVKRFTDNLTSLLQSQGKEGYANASTVGYAKAVAAGYQEIQTASGITRQNKAPVMPWKTWLLWAVLLIGILITGRMAYTLFRDMNSQSS